MKKGTSESLLSLVPFMNEYALLHQADMLIIAAPVYYHGISGQLKCVIVGYLGLENMGVFMAHGCENSSPQKLRELWEFGASLR